MFTTEKCKLFFNDPKFHHIPQWDPDSQESAINKIFSGQRQLRRSKIVYKTIETNHQPNSHTNNYLTIDFLQTRMNAYEDQLVGNVQEMYLQKERIKNKYNLAEDLYQKADRKLKRLMLNLKSQRVDVGQIEGIESEVNEIQRLYQQNQFLKNMNNEIKARIEKKQIQLTSLKR